MTTYLAQSNIIECPKGVAPEIGAFNCTDFLQAAETVSSATIVEADVNGDALDTDDRTLDHSDPGLGDAAATIATYVERGSKDTVAIGKAVEYTVKLAAGKDWNPGITYLLFTVTTSRGRVIPLLGRIAFV